MSDCLVANDGSVARVQIDGDLDAAAVEKLIEDLMACRLEMAPRRWPVIFPACRIALGDGVHKQVQDDGSVLLAVHHGGIGWLGATMPAEGV